MTRRLIRAWYRSLLPDGSVWCESGDPDDFRADGIGASGPLQNGQPMSVTFQRFEIYEVQTPWEPWTP